MTLFLSTFTNRVDSKGRVSVPSPFRSALAGQSYPGIVLFRSHIHPCLEGFAWDMMEDVSARLDRFPLFSTEQDDLATLIFGDSVQLPFDPEGRVVLPATGIKHAQISGAVSFVGMGRKFQVWNPDNLARRVTEARRAVQDKGLTLPGNPEGKAA